MNYKLGRYLLVATLVGFLPLISFYLVPGTLIGIGLTILIVLWIGIQYLIQQEPNTTNITSTELRKSLLIPLVHGLSISIQIFILVLYIHTTALHPDGTEGALEGLFMLVALIYPISLCILAGIINIIIYLLINKQANKPLKKN